MKDKQRIIMLIAHELGMGLFSIPRERSPDRVITPNIQPLKSGTGKT